MLSYILTLPINFFLMSANKIIVFFNKIPIKPLYGEIKFNVYNVAENSRSVVVEAFESLDDDTKNKVKALIINMATNENYKSPQIKYQLKSYNFGEIRPKPHRFFFFQKCGNNYIFFDYVLKKTNTLPDTIYKRINTKKEIYEKEFEKFIKEIQ